MARPLRKPVTPTLLNGRINCTWESFSHAYLPYSEKNSDEVHHKHFSTLCYSGCCNTILFVILGTQSAYTSFHQSVHIWISRVPSQIKWGVKLTWALMSTRNFLFLRNFSIFICILAYCISETNSENLSKFLYFGFILNVVLPVWSLKVTAIFWKNSFRC